MKKALISPNETITYISGWKTTTPPQPIYTTIPNSARVAEVLDAPFEVAPPLFWTDCADNIRADQWYYDTATGAFIVVPAPAPPPQPVSQGAQTL
jgi:hypothetical protein